MFTRLFRKKGNERMLPPKYHPIPNNTQKNRVDSVLVMDNGGFLLSEYKPKYSKLTGTIADESLISMFISAISNFSKELFRRNDGASIIINRGQYIISLESNDRLCIAFIGQYEPLLLYKKLSSLLRKVDSLYKKNEEPNEKNYFEMIKDLIQKEFRETT